MAELNDDAQCCSTDAQSTCCAPEAKDTCCDAAGDACGCGEARADIGEAVRARYAALAATGPACVMGDTVFGASLYEGQEVDAPAGAVNASLGCGVPTAVADLREGETVLDLGSGGGADVLISARRVGPSGHAIGLDMTDEMLEIRETHRVHEHAGSAIVRARKPAA